MVGTLPGVIPNPVYSTFAFLGFLACAIPFPWHLEAWNTGTCLYMFWTGLGCLNLFINSIVWHGNAINWAPVWCDISSRIMLGTMYAIPAASLCINRRLYHIASVQTVTTSRAEKRRAVMVDLAIGLGYPCLMIALQYIVQGHRFNIYEDVGCFPYTYNTPPAFVLVHCQPVIIGLISAVYCVMSIRLFRKRSAQFNELLTGHRNLTSNRYIRLMCLAGADLICTIPLGTWALVDNIRYGVYPWLGWADTHWGFSRVDQVPAIVWRGTSEGVRSMEFTRWSLVVCAIIFFAFFGFADEARKHYRSAIDSAAKKVGITTFTLTGSRSTGTNSSTLDGGSNNFSSSIGKIRPVPPVMVHGEMLSQRRSVDSFTNISVSFHDAGGLLGDEKEKGDFSPDASFGALSLNEFDGTLPDYSSAKVSAPPSSGSSSGSSSPTLSRAPSVEQIPRPAHESDRSPV